MQYGQICVNDFHQGFSDAHIPFILSYGDTRTGSRGWRTLGKNCVCMCVHACARVCTRTCAHVSTLFLVQESVEDIWDAIRWSTTNNLNRVYKIF